MYNTNIYHINRVTVKKVHTCSLNHEEDEERYIKCILAVLWRYQWTIGINKYLGSVCRPVLCACTLLHNIWPYCGPIVGRM